MFLLNVYKSISYLILDQIAILWIIFEKYMNAIIGSCQEENQMSSWYCAFKISGSEPLLENSVATLT